MASTTPNIGLTLPTGAEKVSRQIINDNNTIIDGKMGAVPGGQNLQGEIDALNGKFSTIEDKKITRVSDTSYFTERDAFKARRVGNTIAIFSYVNITTQVPESTNFANTGFTGAEGTFLFFDSTSKATPVICTTGVLKPAATLATGYYYAIGVAVTPI